VIGRVSFRLDSIRQRLRLGFGVLILLLLIFFMNISRSIFAPCLARSTEYAVMSKTT